MGVKLPTNPLAADLDYVVQQTREVWEDIRGKRVFITGGTGFFGSWLLETFAWANAALDLGASALVLTRDPASFAREVPHLANIPSINFLVGDVRTFVFPPGEFSAIVHAATDSTGKHGPKDPFSLFDTIVNGTRHMLEFATKCGARAFLVTSSGAIYGRQPIEVTNVPEEYTGGPDPLDPKSDYGEAKRAAETLCALYASHGGVPAKIARCFAFVGPYLPLDVHFAIGNFIRDGLNGGPIRVNGDGTPFRSYLYAADLAIWLWKILLRGVPCRAYNVGSERAFTIKDVAQTVAQHFKNVGIEVSGRAVPGKPAERYVPRTQRARSELALQGRIDLSEAVRRTIEWHQYLKRAK
jgi:dTDP-glucose 4,6-dehydratase